MKHHDVRLLPWGWLVVVEGPSPDAGIARHTAMIDLLGVLRSGVHVAHDQLLRLLTPSVAVAELQETTSLVWLHEHCSKQRLSGCHTDLVEIDLEETDSRVQRVVEKPGC